MFYFLFIYSLPVPAMILLLMMDLDHLMALHGNQMVMKMDLFIKAQLNSMNPRTVFQDIKKSMEIDMNL